VEMRERSAAAARRSAADQLERRDLLNCTAHLGIRCVGKTDSVERFRLGHKGSRSEVAAVYASRLNVQTRPAHSQEIHKLVLQVAPLSQPTIAGSAPSPGAPATGCLRTQLETG
jgi:hypothetical protein